MKTSEFGVHTKRADAKFELVVEGEIGIFWFESDDALSVYMQIF